MTGNIDDVELIDIAISDSIDRYDKRSLRFKEGCTFLRKIDLISISIGLFKSLSSLH